MYVFFVIAGCWNKSVKCAKVSQSLVLMPWLMITRWGLQRLTQIGSCFQALLSFFLVHVFFNQFFVMPAFGRLYRSTDTCKLSCNYWPQLLAVRLAWIADYIFSQTDDERLHAPGLMAWAITKYGVYLDRCNMFLTAENAEQACKFATLFLHLYLWLAGRAIQERRPLYKMRPKYHSFSCELVNRSKTNRINPKYVGCAMEEDYIGKIASVCKGATHPLTLGKRVLQRCLLGLNVYLMTLASEKPAS